MFFILNSVQNRQLIRYANRQEFGFNQNMSSNECFFDNIFGLNNDFLAVKRKIIYRKSNILYNIWCQTLSTDNTGSVLTIISI